MEAQARRHAERPATWDLLRTYPHDCKLIFVGDASMSPYEIVMEAARSNIRTKSREKPGWSGR